jgi:hypothetical protein
MWQALAGGHTYIPLIGIFIATACGAAHLLGDRQSRRLADRRGKKRGVIAVGDSPLVSMYHMIARAVDYHDLGAANFNALESDRRAIHLAIRLEAMGDNVTLGPTA